MKSNKKRREELRKRREKKEEKLAAPERERLLDEIAAGHALGVSKSEVVSHGYPYRIPNYYRDMPFVCRDCGKSEVWTAKQQKWWHEVVKVEIESTAVRCRRCRTIERDRKRAVREAHLAGLKLKAEKKKKSEPNQALLPTSGLRPAAADL